jgi:hypothetical protein
VDIIIVLLHRATAESPLRILHLSRNGSDKHILSGSFGPGVLLLAFKYIADQSEYSPSPSHFRTPLIRLLF